MDELPPDHVAGDAVAVLAAGADPCLHLAFHLAHGLIDRRAEGVEDVMVARSPIKQRNALGHREGEVITNAAFSPRADRQLLAGFRVKVIAKALEGVLIDRPREPQAVRTLTTPGTDEFLPLRIIVRLRVIALGGCGTDLLRYTNHASFYRTTNPLTKR